MTFGGLLGVVACVEQGDQADELALDTESGDGSDDESNQIDDDDTPPMPGAPDDVASPAADDAQPVSLSVTNPHVRVVGGTGSCSTGSTCVDAIPMTGTVSTLFDTVDHSMRQFMQINCVGGGVLAVSRNGRRVYKRGFGRTKGAASAYADTDCPNNDLNGSASPIRPDTPFPVASVTKFLTAATVRELLIDDGYLNPTIRKAVDHLPTYLKDYFVHTSMTGTCAPLPAYITDSSEDSNPLNCAAWSHPDNNFGQISIGDLIGHSSGFNGGYPYYSESDPWSSLSGEIATMRSNTAAIDWSLEDIDLELTTDYPDELDDARDALQLVFPGENIIFVNYHNARDGWAPVDDYLIRAAGNALEVPTNGWGATDASPNGRDTTYSNNAFRLLGRIAAHLHSTNNAGENHWSAPDGQPELHDDTALGWFLEERNGIAEGVWSEDAIFSRQFNYAPGYLDPTPMARSWNGSEYEWLRRSWSRPWCILYGNYCNFDYWLDAEAADFGMAPDWDFDIGPSSSLVPFHRTQPNTVLEGTGDLAAEMPALLILLDRYYAGETGWRSTWLGMPRASCESNSSCNNVWSGKTGETEGVVSRVVQLRGDATCFDGDSTCTNLGSIGTPTIDGSNKKLKFDVTWSGSMLSWTNPDDVDFAVAVNQDKRENSGGNAWSDARLEKLHRFVMYGLRDDGGTYGEGVDWDAVDRMIHHQGRHIVGMSLDANSDSVYWYEGDGEVTNVVEPRHNFAGLPNTHMGGSPNSAPTYSLPATRIGTDVLGVAIKEEISTDHIYAWYDDGHYSIGIGSNLGSITKSATYTLPNAYGTSNPLKYDQLIDVAFSTAGASFSWYTDGTRASGTASDLDYYWTDDFVVHSQQTIGEVEAVALDWAGDNKTWARYRDGSVSKGNSGSLAADGYWPARPIAMTIAGSYTTFFYATGWYRTFYGTPPDADGSTQVASGYWHSGDGGNPAAYRSPDDMLGWAERSVSAPQSRIFYGDSDSALVTGKVPGSEGNLVFSVGLENSIVDVAVDATASPITYYVYYSNGQRSKGSVPNLNSNLVSYSKPSGKTLIAVARNDSGDTWAAYSDGTYSWGTDTDLDAYGVF
jgi:hypothetical protein